MDYFYFLLWVYLQSKKCVTMNIFVTFNCMHQLDWAKGCPDSWQNIISGCICEGVSGRD